MFLHNLSVFYLIYIPIRSCTRRGLEKACRVHHQHRAESAFSHQSGHRAGATDIWAASLESTIWYPFCSWKRDWTGAPLAYPSLAACSSHDIRIFSLTRYHYSASWLRPLSFWIAFQSQHHRKCFCILPFMHRIPAFTGAEREQRKGAAGSLRCRPSLG